MGQAVWPVPAGAEFQYARWRPEETTLYQLGQEHIENFLAQVEAQTGALQELQGRHHDVGGAVGPLRRCLEVDLLAENALAAAARPQQPLQLRVELHSIMRPSRESMHVDGATPLVGIHHHPLLVRLEAQLAQRCALDQPPRGDGHRHDCAVGEPPICSPWVHKDPLRLTGAAHPIAMQRERKRASQRTLR